MIKKQITPDEVIEYLNELVHADKSAIAALITNRVPCNEQIADHPTMQCREQHGGFHVGMLGVLNGMFGINTDGWGVITAVFNGGNLAHFVKTTSVSGEIKP